MMNREKREGTSDPPTNPSSLNFWMMGSAMHIYGELFKDGTSRASASKAAHALHQAVLLLRAINVPLAHWVPFVHFGL